MTRTALSFVLVAAALAVGPAAHAGEPFHSDPADIQFDGVARVIGTTYTLPLGFEIDLPIIDNFWIGVTVTLTGNQEFGVQVEGTSDVTWGGTDQREGVLYQTITPLEGSGAAGMQSDVRFDITFDIWQGSYGTGSRVIQFPLYAQGIAFKLDAEPFTPFMLPGQEPSSQTLQTRSQDLAFDRTFSYPIGLAGVVDVTPGVRLRGWPQANAYFTGTDLQTTWLDGDMVISQGLDYPGEIELYDPLPSIELSSAYDAFVQSTIAYVFTADFTITINIIGILQFPFGFHLFDYTVPLFSGSEDVSFDSAAYTHPLPMFAPSVEEIKFGQVDVGKTETFTYLFNNDGQLELLGLVGLQGDAAFTAAPNQVGAAPGGQDSIVVTFTPDVAGDFDATLELQTNDPTQPTREVHVSGKGKDVVTPPDDNPDNGSWEPVPHETTTFTGCGCASTPTGTGLLPLVALVPLVAIRRRRKA